MKPVFAYEINDVVLFDQGNQRWDYRGEGKILLQQEYITCNAYLVEMPDGVKTQVREDQISGKK
ncbi:hypothetical protein CL97_gp086 [Cronobacter phage CR9]|uniref:Uncharacterized protein n=1 Tax=Cronobacter phage CR9 TaxID=1162290 RepID=M1F3I6_9CAUD|nr:hypothetical protein CL97_gp086 [Cronobacter phage CR9]AFH20970.1 hypothetical protein CR9_086 [Cronobacter phage CR9]